MAYDTYDPHGGAQTPWEVTKDIAGSFFSPSTYFSAMGSMPNLWNTKKGIWVPLGMAKDRAKHWAAFKGAWTEGSILTRPIRGLWHGLRSIGGGGYLGGGVLERGQTAQAFQNSMRDEIYRRLHGSMGDKIYNAATRKGIILDQARKGASGMGFKGTQSAKLSKVFSDEIVDWLDEAGDMSKIKKPAAALEKRLRKLIASKDFVDEFGKLKVKEIVKGLKVKDIIKSRPASLAGKLGIKNAATAGAVFKTAIKGGKMVSVVGMMSFMWDIANMVGQPLGRAAMSQLDTALTQFGNRFTPNMGGELQLSYLTRGAATERQRAINAISKAHINGRSAFGNEAQYVH